MSARVLENLDTVLHQYDVFLVDAWGVLHDGKSLYPGARKMLELLRATDKKVIILSNAARRITAFKNELLKLDISMDMYTEAVTSGELTWQALSNASLSECVGIGPCYYYQGPSRSRGLMDGLALEEVNQLAAADFIMNTGMEGNQPNADAFGAMLGEARELNLPMICANPDRLAIRGGVLGISAGAIAQAYEQLGGKVIYFGKPYLAIYQTCFDLFPEVDLTAFVMLGDGLATDIKGANQAGIDSVFLGSGIHQVELSGAGALTQNALFEQYQAWPNYILFGLGSV